MRSTPAQGTSGRSRLQTSLNAVVARPLVAVIGLLLIGCSGPGTVAIPRSASSPSVHAGTATLPPEGKLLLYTNDGPVILSHAEDRPISLQRPGETIWAADLSPDGAEVLALSFQREPTGITREPRILVVDVDTTDRRTVVRVGPRGDLGPALWSPDGARIAYRLTVYGVDPAKVHPYRHGQRTSLCTLDLRTEFARCFSGLGRVDGFGWSPDGQTLVVDVVGTRPLWKLDPASGRRSVLVPPRGRWIERAGLSEPVTFTSPGWSPSGRYVSAWVNNTPIVFHADGRLAAVGQHSREFTEALGWSPTEDLFVYARGDPPQFTEIRLLDPRTGEDRRLVSAEGYPYITGLVWSPSGRWLAVLRWQSSFKQRIDVIDVTGDQPPMTTERADSPVRVDWGP
jgi:Tol biopolymer transport system component